MPNSQIEQGGHGSVAKTGNNLPDNGEAWDFRNPSGTIVAKASAPGSPPVVVVGGTFPVDLTVPDRFGQATGYELRLSGEAG